MNGKHPDSSERGAGQFEWFRRRARDYPVSAFFLISCFFSWTLWGLMIAHTHGRLAFPFPLNPLGSFGPAVGALLVAAARPGDTRALLRSLCNWRMRWSWFAGAILVPGTLWGLGFALYLALGGPAPAPPNYTALPWIPLYFPAILVLGGPLGEEPGWRGLALPKLLQRMNPMTASAVLAAMWLVWHLPLFWLEGSSQAGGSIPFFAGAVCAFAFLFTWVFVRTGGNLLAAVLFHTGINTTSVVFGAVFPAIDSDRAFSVSFLAVLCATASALAVLDRRVIFHRPRATGAPVDGAG